MTDFAAFESHFDETGDQTDESAERFAYHRRFLDLSHTVDVDADEIESADDSALAHPEIIELIESMLVANPNLQPGSAIGPSVRPHSIYVPEYYEAAYAYPLVVWFHGDGSSEAELGQLMPLVSERNYIGAALRGPAPCGSGFSWSSDGSNIPKLLDDVRRTVVSLRREYHIHSERIYLAGFAGGATTAIQLMLSKPEWFGGVISFGGQMPVAANVSRPEDLKGKRILLATSLGSKTTRVGDVVAAGRILYSAGMKVGTRVYQDCPTTPTRKMLRDLDSWLMDDICDGVKV